jgi:hypothetical protein
MDLNIEGVDGEMLEGRPATNGASLSLEALGAALSNSGVHRTEQTN